MLRVAEQWADSDLGRQRQGNEDSFYVRSPLFVVADGMGGAQAGEVASETAVRAFERGLPDGEPASGLVRLIEEANRRIHDRSRSDAHMAGMGTTLTAAYVAADDAVVIAHVGDSRAYLYRDGDLVRLTRDHSLVGELVARGKLTEEQAESHPQRSVITRALGPEPRVDVDVETHAARADDVFLVCSDGLTSMVPEAEVRRILAEAPGLEQAGRALISAANAAGGRDNITVILFRVESVDGGRAATAGPATVDAEADTGEYDTFEGEAVQPPRQGVGRPTAEQPTEVHPTLASDEAEAEYRRSGTVAVQAVPRAHPAAAATRAPARRRPVGGRARELPGPAPPPRTRTRAPRLRRVLKVSAVVAVLLAIVLAAGLQAIRAVYFIGVDHRDRTITIYRGVPYELPFGVDLYTRYGGSGVTIDAVPPTRRDTFTDHKLRSRDDAEALVNALERGQVRR